MYKNIVNPITGKNISINSKQGKSILNKYLSIVGGATIDISPKIDLSEKPTTTKPTKKIDLKNYTTTNNIDCWFDSVLYFLLGNYDVRESILNYNRDKIKRCPSIILYNEFRQCIADILDIDIDNAGNSFLILINFIPMNNLHIGNYDNINVKIIEPDLPFVIIDQINSIKDVRNTIKIDKINYRLKSIILSTRGMENMDKMLYDHSISIFFNNGWIVADNEKKDFVEIDNPDEYRQIREHPDENLFYIDFGRWSFNKCDKILLYLPEY